MRKISFYLLWSFLWLLSLLPFWLLFIISNGLYYIIYHLAKYRRKVVFTNLHNAFPEKSNNEIEIIAKKFYRHFCDLVIETIKLITLSKKEHMKRVKYINIDVLNKYYDDNKNVIIACGHYGNWETTSQIGFFSKHFPLPVYKPLNDPLFNKYIFKQRNKYIAEPIPMHLVLRKLLQYKKDNILILLALVADQTPLKSEIQYWTKFLNQDTAIYLGTEKIAKKFNYPVIYLHMDKPKRGYYDIHFRVLCEEPALTKDYEITELHTRALEENIIKRPELWLWSHRRWKHKKNKN